MSIVVLFFASAKDAAGTSKIEVDLPSGTPFSTEDLKLMLNEKYPLLHISSKVAMLAVNQVYVTEPTALKDRDVVAIIPPISGG